jgi:hypothetical protein
MSLMRRVKDGFPSCWEALLAYDGAFLAAARVATPIWATSSIAGLFPRIKKDTPRYVPHAKIHIHNVFGVTRR